MDSMKRQKDMLLKDEPPRMGGAQYTTGEKWTVISHPPVRMRQWGQSRSDARVWMCLVVEVKSSAVRNSIA